MKYPYHYSIHGNPEDGWRLTVYKINKDDSVSPYSERKEYKTLKDIRDKIVELEKE